MFYTLNIAHVGVRFLLNNQRLGLNSSSSLAALPILSTIGHAILRANPQPPRYRPPQQTFCR